ncbi:MAG: helix-turn-helix domain-containing protein [Sporomusa sp.]
MEETVKEFPSCCFVPQKGMNLNMTDELMLYVGRKIRLFRKAKGLSLMDLAALISKSKTTVSKYETGKIAIDVLTLRDITVALGVDFAQLLDYGPIPPNKTTPLNNPFGYTDTLFLYHMYEDTIYSSVIKLVHDASVSQIRATLYYKLTNIKELEQCNCIYIGQMQCHENILSFTLKNYRNDIETALLNFFIPMNRPCLIAGLLTGLKSNTLQPIGFKVVLSKERLKYDQNLKDALTISRESFRKMKKSNYLLLESLS